MVASAIWPNNVLGQSEDTNSQAGWHEDRGLLLCSANRPTDPMQEVQGWMAAVRVGRKIVQG